MTTTEAYAGREAREKLFLFVFLFHLWYHVSVLMRAKPAVAQQMSLTTWGCRVSTDAQVEELQAEVSVCTLVKQPTKQ